MDNLHHKLVWIDGSCYRVHPNHYQELSGSSNTEPDQAPYIEEDCDDDEDLEDLQFVTHNGRFKVSMPVATMFYGIIIGAKGSTLKRLENETKTSINVPSRGKSGDVVIAGPEKKCVASAVRRIKMMILAKRQTMRPTHFISVPINSEEVVEKYVTFKNEILKNFMGNDIQESYLTPEKKLHLTLCVLLLANDAERAMAVKLLEEAHETIAKPLLNGKQISLNFKGLSYMNDDPSKVKVLYIEVEENEIFRIMIDKINEYFVKSGLVTRHRPIVKLHMTIINTKRNEDEAYDKTFDASKILNNFKDITFGTCQLSSMHVSVMGSSSDDYYTSTGSVQF